MAYHDSPSAPKPNASCFLSRIAPCYVASHSETVHGAKPGITPAFGVASSNMTLPWADMALPVSPPIPGFAFAFPKEALEIFALTSVTHGF